MLPNRPNQPTIGKLSIGPSWLLDRRFEGRGTLTHHRQAPQTVITSGVGFLFVRYSLLLPNNGRNEDQDKRYQQDAAAAAAGGRIRRGSGLTNS